MSEKKIDGQIFFNENDITEPTRQFPDEVIFEGDEGHPISIEFDQSQRTSQVIYERQLARWKDPLTPPKTRNKCVKMCRVGPVRTCCGWKLETKWYYRRAILIVSTKTPADIKSAIEDCMKVAAVAAAIAAIVTGGSAAVAAAEKAFTACLMTKLGDNLASVRIDLSGYWGDWS